MATDKAIMWVERWVWMLIYGGAFSVVIGISTRADDPAIGWSLIVVGSLVALAGAVLIWVRSRMHEEN